ncbi:MAG TPA: sugar ABC transporter permease [Anaerolineae bacterium]|nr:sugar ABC transporter permease [Anaerolineae bacterium]
MTLDEHRISSSIRTSQASRWQVAWWRFWRTYEGYLFLGPNIVGFLTFTAFPVVAAFALSFFRWDLLTPPVYVGTLNFKRLLLSDQQFRKVMFNTFYFTVGTVPPRVVLSLLLALALNQRIRGITTYRLLYFMPVVSSLVAVALVWQWIFNGNFGILNSSIWAIAGWLGIRVHPPDWLNNSKWAMPAVMILNLWKNVGFTMVIYLAGLQAIPQELYEAAEVDGAGTWARFRHITLPMISPTTFFVVVMSMIWAFQVFAEAFIMTKGGPAFATTTMVYYVYLNAFQWFRMGKAAAVAWILFAIIFVFTLIQMRYQQRWVHYEGERR